SAPRAPGRRSGRSSRARSPTRAGLPPPCGRRSRVCRWTRSGCVPTWPPCSPTIPRPERRSSTARSRTTAMPDDERYERGLRVRREVLGDEHVDRSLARASELTGEFQELITRYAWGEIWARPGLDRRTRSCITLTALVALGRFDELAMHIRGARRNGLSDDEIAEVLLHSAVYCGVPAANSAFAVFRRVLDEA